MPSDNHMRKQQVRDWLERIDKAIAFRKDEEEDWKKNYKAVYGDNWRENGKRDNSSSDGISKQKYNYDKLLSFLKTELPALVLHQPDVYLSIRKERDKADPMSQDLAKQLEARLDTLLSDADGWATDIRCVLADAYCAYAISKTIPTYKIEPHPEAGNPIMMGGEMLVDDETGQPLMHPDEQVAEGGYDIGVRVSPFKFFVDDQTKNNGYKSAFRGEEINITLAQVKAEGLYEPEIIAALEEKIREKQGESKKDWEIDLTLYEVYDRTENKIIVICKEYDDDFVRYDDIPKGIEGDPYDTLKFTEIPGQWWPKPEMTVGRLQQEEYRQGREWLRSWAKKATPQLGIKKSFYESDPTEAGKIGDGSSDYVKVNSEGDVFLLNKDAAGANASLKEHMAMVTQDFDETMGQPAQARGVTGDADFATEVEVAAMKGDLRAQDKLLLVKVFLGSQIEKVLKLMTVNPKENPEIQQALQQISADLDIEISIENKSPKNRAIERKQMMEAADRFPPLGQSPTYIKQLLKTFDSIREQDTILQEIMQMMQAQAEAAKPQGPEQKPMSVSLNIKGETLPVGALDAIVDTFMQKDIPIASPGAAGVPPGPAAPSPASAGAGTEGMEPGSGMLPGGEVI